MKKDSYENFDLHDIYWILRQLWSGKTVKDLSLAMDTQKQNIYVALKRHGYFMSQARKKVIKKFKLPHDCGYAEIARELGISRERVRQKVNQCRSPYIKYQCTGRRKKSQ